MGDSVRVKGRRPTWRDPRLGIGVLLVAASVALGSWVVSAADHTVTVWAATGVLSPGQQLSAQDFHQVSVAAPEVADIYLTSESPEVEGLVVLRTVGAGELIPRTALGGPDSVEERTVTVPVNSALADVLEPASRVDLWVAAPDPEDSAMSATLAPEPLVEGVEVAAVQENTSLFAGSQQMIAQLLVPREELAGVLAARAGDSQIMIVPVPV